jgi:hypothetical protein
VPEAIFSVVPVLGIITFVILMCIVWGGRTDIFHWLDKDVVANDPLLNGKKGFLNPVFFTVWSTVTIFLWWLSEKNCDHSVSKVISLVQGNYETGRKWINKISFGRHFLLCFFGLTVGSTIPWLGFMSIDAIGTARCLAGTHLPVHL